MASILNRWSLHPFAAHVPGELTVECSVTGTEEMLYLLFAISGDVDSLVIPGRTEPVCRLDGLWQTTCCECFFKVKGEKEYWELNVSPNGCWNLYRFSGYRREMTREERVTTLASETILENGKVFQRCLLPIDGIVRPDEEMVLGLSCVLEHTDGEKSYWALSHPDEKPDFHHPGGFTAQLNRE